jgi:hypothetical protein
MAGLPWQFWHSARQLVENVWLMAGARGSPDVCVGAAIGPRVEYALAMLQNRGPLRKQ